MNKPYTLHYAPDNASFIVRIALEMIGAPYETVLVDRNINAQHSPAYLALNPLGMIPALETPDGVIFETGAILLWLADQQAALFPAAGAPTRGEGLKWLFFISNSLHAGLRQMFYPDKFIAPEQCDALRAGIAQRIRSDLKQIDRLIADPQVSVFGNTSPNLLDIYVCACFRWAQIYPARYEKNWVKAEEYPNLRALARRIERLPSIQTIQAAEGLGLAPFSNPTLANPSEGSAT